jgi:hypothetical protein
MLSCNLSQFLWISQLITVISQCRNISYGGDTKDGKGGGGGSGLAGYSLLSRAALILVDVLSLPACLCFH